MTRTVSIALGVASGIVLGEYAKKFLFTDDGEFDTSGVDELKSFISEKFYDLAERFEMKDDEDGSEEPSTYEPSEDELDHKDAEENPVNADSGDEASATV